MISSAFVSGFGAHTALESFAEGRPVKGAIFVALSLFYLALAFHERRKTRGH